jgi:cytoskeleton protein RodZ
MCRGIITPAHVTLESYSESDRLTQAFVIIPLTMSETIGELLKKTRLEKGLTLDEVFQALHIRPHFLDALERNQRDLLPSDVQGRGFLRMYADFLCLPASPLMIAWENNSVIVAEPEEAAEELPIEENLPALPETPSAEPAPLPEQIQESEPEPEPVAEEELKPSGTIFQEIGKQLSQRREILGISLSDIEQHLHIRLHYLKALEAGKVDDLPSLAQGRGMLSNYARFLELDTEAMLMRFADAQQARRVERIAPQSSGKGFSRHPRSPSKPSVLKRFLTPDLLVISLVIVVFFGFAIWSAAQVNAISTRQNKITPPSIAQMLLITPSETVSASTSLPGGAMNTPVDEAETTKEASSNEEPTQVPTLDNLPLQVYVIASQRAWMRITADGKVVFDGRVMIGNAYPYSAKNTIQLETGSGAAVEVYFNQKDLGKMGTVGQVVNLIFSQEGMVTPTASFTATPTATQVFTVTLQPTAVVPTSTITPYVPK